MKINNVRVYGLEESIIASGYPMMTDVPDQEEFNDLSYYFNYYLSTDVPNSMYGEDITKGIKRIKNLASSKSGSGHDCALKGVVVQYDLTAPEYFWRQFDRYHFHDYISSQSKMHRLLKFDIEKMCNKYVRQDALDILQEEVDVYNDMINIKEVPKEQKQDQFQRVISNCPMGIELTARITDNYLQLKSKYKQRKNHKLVEWKIYCDWVETLPMAKELIVNAKE